MHETNQKRKATRLKRMVDATTTEPTTWTADDLRAMLEHQLSVPLATDLVPVVDEAEATLSMEATHAELPQHFGELLSQPHPPLAPLRLMKDFCKNLLKAEDQQMPRDLLNVLYYAAILAALVKRDTRISQLDVASLRKGCAWCLKRDWLTDGLRDLFEEGQNYLHRT